MAETIPRWGMAEVNFLETDADQIKADIIKDYETAAGRTLADGDPVRLFLLTIAAEIIQLREEINWSAQQNLLTYATGEYLDALGVFVDVERLGAAGAVTTIKFTLSEVLGNAFTIPAGFEVTNGDVTFATDKELVIEPGELEGEVSATCTEPGTVGNNYLAGQIDTIVKPMAFLESAENTTTSTGGSEVEDDASYAERIRLRVNSYSVAGPRLAYEYYAKSYSSAISDVAVTSPTPGYVYVCCLLENGELPSETWLQGLYEYLSADTIRPLTDFVVCVAPTAVEYKIVLNYWINSEDSGNVETIQANVQAAAEEYKQWQQERIGRDITPAKLVQLVMEAGASRIDADTMEPAEFVEIEGSQIAQCTSIEVNYMGYKDI